MTVPGSPPIAVDPVEAARSAGLHHVDDKLPGIRRRRRGRAFEYVHPSGQKVADGETLDRIRALAVPPAWTDVWICVDRRGHLQATGRDARGRKQYRYHREWRRVRDENKYDRLIAFGRALPRIRRRVAKDLGRRDLPREKVLATVVRLLESTLIRVGNEEYAKANRSFGLTTMRGRHVKVEGSEVRFAFRGKSGKEHEVGVRDRRLASVVRRLEELPGQLLFQYVDEQGVRQAVDSGDVNEYLGTIAGEDFTAKDFRTWAGTVLASRALNEFERYDSQAQAKQNVVAAVESVARRLGNTRSVCLKCYVHPAVVDSYLDGSMLDTVRRRAAQEFKRSLRRLDPAEAAVLALLQERLRRDAHRLRSRRAA